MSILPIILIAIVMAVDGGLTPLGRAWPIPNWAPWLEMWLPPLVILVIAWLGVRLCAKRLARGRVPGPLITADRLMRATRWLIVINHIIAVLVLDGLGAVRRVTGDLVLVDELLTTLPALLALVATWWIYYPIERLLVQASLVRRLDAGSPIYPTLTRGQYVLVQVRMNLLLMLVPVLLIAGLSEAIDDLWKHWRFGSSGVREGATIVLAAMVFMFAPVMARLVLDVEPLPKGPLRDGLAEVCRRHHVGVRDLLLWKTSGSMINAAVMGLIAPLRYVLITDALLETLHANEVQAVMAHEVGHVRRRHMVWMVVCLLACFFLAAHVVAWPVRMAGHFARWQENWEQPLEIGCSLLQLTLGLIFFGWVCRRFERQADTFAAQHLSGLGTPVEEQASITPDSVSAMRTALESIAELNTVDPSRHSWRHGSIRWRQRYLASIVGRPLLRLPIDRLVGRLKIASALVLALGLGYEIAQREAAENDAESVPRFTGAEGARVRLSDQSPVSRENGKRRGDVGDSSESARLTGEMDTFPANPPTAPVSRGTGRSSAEVAS